MIKTLHSFLTLFLLSTISMAQPVDAISTIAEQMPYFMGCTDLENGTSEKRQCSNQNLIDFINRNVQYPQTARDKGIEGTVLVKFVVNHYGMVESSEVLRDIGGDCGKEALRIVELMPEWEPALNTEGPISVSLNLPVTFSLQNEKALVVNKYQIQWGTLRGDQITKEELKEHITKKLYVRDEMGEEVDISTLTFAFERKRTFLEATSTGRINKKMEKLIKKVKKGGTFIVVAAIQKEGEIYEIEREFEVL